VTQVEVAAAAARSASKETGGRNVDAAGLARALASCGVGEVRFGDSDRAMYSVDASKYRQVPIGVVVPGSVEAAVAAVSICREFGAPVLSRGGGTSLAGQCCNIAVVLDWSKHCTALLSVDAAARTAVVEPGIKLDVLNEQLAEHGLMYGPKPATHLSCTIGGMVGNNSCGSTAQAYGKVVDNVRRLEVLTYDGERMWVGATSSEEYASILAAGGRRAEIYRGMRDLRDRYLSQIRTRYPKIPRRVSGYNLDSLLPEAGFHVARALVGSESTLITVLRAELDLVPLPGAKALVALGYPSAVAAASAVPRILSHHPHRLEGMDDTLVDLERRKHLHAQALHELPRGAGWLLVEFTGDDQTQADARAGKLLDDLSRTEHDASVRFLDAAASERELWEVREGALGATAQLSDGRRAWDGWEDSAVAPEDLADYLTNLQRLYAEFGYNGASIYGHFGQGCVHTRIPFDLQTAPGIAAMRRFVEAAADLVASYGGSFSGEHGDGQARGELLPKMFGAEIVRAFQEFKAIWDPDERMNPGKVVRPYRLDENLRLGVDYRPPPLETAFGYPDDQHDFAQAALRCVGVGKCRRDDGGVMCPSYMVTHEERYSTRGRARLLWEMLNGELRSVGWRSAAVRDALDLCLACKGCKSDCPVNVDMATYKAEFLYHHYRGRLRPRAHYSMGWLPVLARLAAAAPGAVNALAQAPGISAVGKRLAGVAGRRSAPVFASERFTDSFRPPSDAGRPRVVLWPDTFNNSFTPAVAHAAARVLDAAGLAVSAPTAPVCCGLTWISTGQLDVAKRMLQRALDVLRDDLRAGVPVVVLEPSCAAVFRSDAGELFPSDPDVARLRGLTVTLGECLQRYAPDWRPPRIGRKAVVQVHCHQHAVLGFGADRQLLADAGVDVDVLDSGCCGLAGNFGFEAGHYDVSMACAERVLLPAVRGTDPDTVVLADGFSCRTQIEQGFAGRKAVHVAELLALALAGRLSEPWPVESLVDRPAVSRRAGVTATAATGAAAAAVVLAAAAAVRRTRA